MSVMQSLLYTHVKAHFFTCTLSQSDFWKNGTHSSSSTSPLALFSLFLLSVVSVAAGDSGWQPPGFFKANITAKDELQVCQACKHALITLFFSSG